MSHLRIYTVHINPSMPNPYEEARFIEEGFNWKAFLFSGLWTLYHKLWLPTLFILIVNGLLVVLSDHAVSHQGAACIFIAWNTIIGAYGNDWLRTSLKKRGYIIADIVTGDSLLRAEQRFFDRYFSSREAVPALSS